VARFQISTADNGKQLAIRVGDELLVELPENPTTGYRWQLNSSGDASLTLDRDEFELPTNSTAGSGGTRHISLRASSTGHSQLRLELRRAWEQGQSAVEEFAVPIEVRPR
jgi:inhibitor of cysteine peptidase